MMKILQELILLVILSYVLMEISFIPGEFIRSWRDS